MSAAASVFTHFWIKLFLAAPASFLSAAAFSHWAALPLAEARLAQLQAQAEEIARLRAQAVPEPLVGVPLLEVLRASATARDLTLNIQMSEGGVAVSGQGGFDALWVWLAEIQRDHALRVVKLEMDRGGIVATLVQTTAR